MNAALLVLVLAQWSSSTNTNQAPIESRQNGAKLSNTRQFAVDCRTGMTCSVDGGTLYLTSSGGVGGGADPAAPFIAWTTDTTGLTNERVLSAGNYTTIDTATAGQVKTNWAHGLTCSAGQAFTSSGTSALACTSTITASDLACSGTCVADAEIAGVSGAKVSGTVSSASTATALATNPADCGANQFATTIAANGDLSCAQPAFAGITGTVSNGQLASSYSGVGACGANSWASTLSANAAPTCTQPGFSNLSGSAGIAQGGTGVGSRAANDVVIGTGINTTATKVLPSCSNATTSKLLYDSATQAFSCGTDQTSGGGGAPTTATYITQTADATLTAEQALSSLSTGLLKVTTGTGVLSTAVASTDYAPATSGSAVLLGNGTGGFSSFSGSSCASDRYATSSSTAGALSCGQVTIAGLSATGTPSATTYLRGDGTWSTPAGGGGSPGGSSGQVQYNNAGAFAGASKVSINANGSLVLSLDSSPATPATDTVGLFGRKVGGRMLPAIKGPSGLDTSLQPLLARNKVGWANPNGNSTTIGLAGLALTATGTATAANWASTSLHTSLRRIDYLVTTAATTAVAGWRGAAAQFWRGNGAGLGGFHYVVRWAPATGAATTTSRCFAGLWASTAASTDVQPSTLTNAVGLGFDAADANLQIFTNDNTGTATKTDLGASFVVPTTDRAKVYELALFAPPNGSSITYEATDLVTGAVATGTLSTDLPVNTTALNVYGYCSVGGTSSVIGISLFSLYIETDS